MVTSASILPLELAGVTVRKNGQVILDNIELTFGAKGFTIVMGPNGAGKTTLLRLLHGLERPRGGKVQWAVSQSESKNQQAFVFQTPILLRRTMFENLIYPLRITKTAKEQAEQLTTEWMEKINLADKAGLSAQMLSGGEKQKLAIARALITKPQVLFLDEPTTNLDGASTREIELILNSALQSGTRIIMTTHDIGQAKRLASDIIFIHKGTVRETTISTEFFNNPMSEEARAYLRGDIVE